ncbi:MAG: hypothetical protein WA294_12520 [Acidobacteriaceae bacterium]
MIPKKSLWRRFAARIMGAAAAVLLASPATIVAQSNPGQPSQNTTNQPATPAQTAQPQDPTQATPAAPPDPTQATPAEPS